MAGAKVLREALRLRIDPGGGGDAPRLGATPTWDLATGVAFNAPIFCNGSARPECTE